MVGKQIYIPRLFSNVERGFRKGTFADTYSMRIRK